MYRQHLIRYKIGRAHQYTMSINCFTTYASMCIIKLRDAFCHKMRIVCTMSDPVPCNKSGHKNTSMLIVKFAYRIEQLWGDGQNKVRYPGVAWLKKCSWCSMVFLRKITKRIRTGLVNLMICRFSLCETTHKQRWSSKKQVSGQTLFMVKITIRWY